MAFNIVAGVNNAVYGSVSGSGSYVEGAEVTLEVTANDGYRFVSWDDGDTDNPRVFNATEDVTLVATLEIIPEYTISVTVNDNSLGTVSGSGTFREGTSTQISATPYVHSRFVNWEDGNSDNPRTIAVSAAATYKAIFEAVNYFTISTDVNDVNLGSVTGAGEYDEGNTVTLTAVPETGCRFVSWSDGNTDNPRIFTSSADATYTATFEEIQYTDVTIASNDVSWGTVSGATSGNIETGTTITLTATPATDYKFDGWQVDGDVVSVSPTASFLVDGREMDIIAVFSAIVFYQVTLITNDIECGSISVVSATEEPRGDAHNIWPDGTIINLQAVTTEGGKFLNWSTGQITTEITVNVHSNETIRANFYPATGLILVTKKILQQTWSTIKSFFSASTGASKIGAPANNALGATTLADVVNSAGQPGGIAMLNNSGKVAAADIDGTLTNDTTGNAATASVADKVGTTTVGASDTPIYLNAGTPTACGTSLAVDITGNAATATSAAECSGNSATATSATKVRQTITTVNNSRPILCAYIEGTSTTSDVTNAVLYANKCSLNPSTGILTATGFSGPLTGNVTGDCSGSSGSCSGNAATATTATNANNAKLTHTVGNTEYPLVFGTSFVITDAQQALRIGTPTATAANCALRAKAYCAAANTQGESYIVIGNNIAKTAANNSRGGLYLYGTGTTWAKFQAGDQTANKTVTLVAPADVTLTLPSATGTIALTSSDITGNAATATTATSATSATSATTATNANNLKVTHTGAAWRDILAVATGFTSASNQAVYGHNSGSVAYYVDANATSGDQRAILRLGNATANTTAAGHSGELWIYGTSTLALKIKTNPAANKVITIKTTGDTAREYTLPDAAGTIALTSSNITGSSASCTGNAATATTASACSGNAASSTYATNIRVTDTDSNTWYPLVFSTGSAASTNYAARVDADSILVYPGTAPAANTQGNCYLQLGNNKAKATAGNKRGILRIYGTSTSYTEITSAVGSTARSISFPDKAGTVALTSDIPTAGHTWCTTAATTTSTASSTNPAVVVTNYVNGTAWYRVWSDGWIEQGDCSLVPGNGTGSEYTFKKAFSTNNITITASQSGTGSGEGCSVSSVSTTKMRIATEQSGRNFRFYACGY